MDHEVYKNLTERKLTSGVKGDLHPQVVKACMIELVHPVACIYREAIRSHTWPKRWHLEHQIVIPKVPQPKTKDDMRNLGLSTFFNSG